MSGTKVGFWWYICGMYGNTNPLSKVIALSMLIIASRTIHAQDIPVGDTAFVTFFQVSIQGCALGSSEISHTNNDFFFVAKDQYQGSIYFAPTKIGIQTDTFI